MGERVRAVCYSETNEMKKQRGMSRDTDNLLDILSDDAFTSTQWYPVL